MNKQRLIYSIACWLAFVFLVFQILSSSVWSKFEYVSMYALKNFSRLHFGDTSNIHFGRILNSVCSWKLYSHANGITKQSVLFCTNKIWNFPLKYKVMITTELLKFKWSHFKQLKWQHFAELLALFSHLAALWLSYCVVTRGALSEAQVSPAAGTTGQLLYSVTGMPSPTVPPTFLSDGPGLRNDHANSITGHLSTQFHQAFTRRALAPSFILGLTESGLADHMIWNSPLEPDELALGCVSEDNDCLPPACTNYARNKKKDECAETYLMSLG